MKVLLLLLLLIIQGCGLFSGRHLWRQQEGHLATVNNNVCKRLSDDVLIYAVFVDSKSTGSWTTHDIKSTLDSIRKASDWLVAKAVDRGIPLNITVASHERGGVVPVRSELPRYGIPGALRSMNPGQTLDRWSDKAGRQVLAAFPRDTARITLTKIQPKDSERLIARLRDTYRTDNVALIYFVNNYFGNETSVAMNTASGDKVEYAVVSFKRPGVIIHEFLHLFRALDLYMTPFDGRKEALKRKAFAMQEFPDEIMAFPFRQLDSLSISPVTEYLIGWRDELPDRYARMLVGKKVRLAKY